MVKEWIAVEPFRAKEKINAKPQQVVRLDVCRKSPTLIIKVKTCPPKHDVKKQDLTKTLFRLELRVIDARIS